MTMDWSVPGIGRRGRNSMTNEELRATVEERQGAVAIVKELEKQIEKSTQDIKEEMRGRNVRRVVLGAWVPKVIHQERETIDPKLLLSAGVSIAQIEAATVKKQV